MAIRWDDVIRASGSQVSSRLGDEVAILELDAGMYFGLNPSGAMLWERLQEPVAVASLHAAIVSAYEVDEDVARRDLLRLLEQMQESGLVEVCDAHAR